MENALISTALLGGGLWLSWILFIWLIKNSRVFKLLVKVAIVVGIVYGLLSYFDLPWQDFYKLPWKGIVGTFILLLLFNKVKEVVDR